MLIAVADTHALLWYIYNDSRLSSRARQVFAEAVESENSVGFSPITYVELIYLQEKQRVDPAVLERFIAAIDAADSILLELPITRFVAMSVLDVVRAQVPDLPDRVISATTIAHRVPLITRDRRIATSSVQTIW